MANELKARYATFGLTVYAVLIRASDGQAYNGAGFVTVSAAAWPSYFIPAYEQDAANGTGVYYASMPANIPAGLYEIWFFRRVGATAAPSDTLITQQYLDWSGTVELGLSSITAGGTGTFSVTVGGYAAGKDPYTLVVKTPMTEGYAPKNTQPTLEQMSYMCWSALSEFGVNGTSIVCRKIDDATTAMTFSLDSATLPTNRTRVA